MKCEFQYYANLEEMSSRAAWFLRDLAHERVAASKAFTLVLAGGGTPRRLYEILASPEFRATVPWPRTHIFWGDERCVPSDHPDSNFRMAHEAMLSKLELAASQIHRIPAEMEPPELAAAHYEMDLRRFFQSLEPNEGPAASNDKLYPCTDLILLGIGPDGHTASLFPGDPALSQEHQWVTTAPKPVGKPSVPRITLTLPVINQARNVLFLLSGPGKEHVVKAMMTDYDHAGRLYPAALVRPAGRLQLFHDCRALR